jgi:RsiW-degrading membrane proteinase PrsW (M82 family)
MPGRPRDSVAFTVVVTVLVGLGAVPIGLVIALSGAPSTMVVATLLAAVPVGPVVACFLWLDRYEPEPRRLLALGLVWGGVVATGISLVLGGIGGLLVPLPAELGLAVVAPVTEELGKGLFLLLLLWWRRHELDGVLDGIVYAGMVGVGFAFVENILYLAAAYDGTDGLGPGGIEAVTGTFVVRALFSPFAHPLFTAFTGIGVGIAVAARSGALRFTAPVTGYLLAVTAHGLWNGSTLLGFGGFVGTYVLLMVPGFVFVVLLAVWARRTEAKVLHAALHDAAARGLLPVVDIAWLVDLRARRASRRYAAATGGAAAATAVREYQQAAIELGFLHHRYLRGTPPPDFAVRGQHFVARIQAVRPYVRLPGQVVPTR